MSIVCAKPRLWITGRAGSRSWTSTTPARISAFESATLPARVTGLVAPAIGSALSINGSLCPDDRRHSSTEICDQCNGLKQE